MSFDSTKIQLGKLLEQVHSLSLQLPEFQRDYVWSEDSVVSLLASIAKGYPVGALLVLERGGEVDFKPRPIEGTQNAQAVTPELLLLDGQQRITSLYQALWSKHPARLKNARGQYVNRHLFLDIRKALSTAYSFEEAIEILPEDKKRSGGFGNVDREIDLSSEELQFENWMFPLNLTFSENHWLLSWMQYYVNKGENITEKYIQFSQLLNIIKQYEMPIIKLNKDNTREAVCTIFEKVNVGGVKLDAFELITAIYAGSNFDLRKDWYGTPTEHGRLGKIRQATPDHGVHASLGSLDFLQACTILHTQEVRAAAVASGKQGLDLPQVTCRRDALLLLKLDAYLRHADQVQAGFIEAGKFLNEQKILWGRDVPYPPQVVTLAALFAKMGTKDRTATVSEKLTQWFWTVVLGEYYGSSSETKIARDVPEIEAWIAGGPMPRTLEEAIFQVSRLRSLRSRGSAAYKGFHALLMRSGCRDFIGGQPVEVMTVYSSPIDIHHIFPRAWCEKNNIPPNMYNSIINKTAISSATNKIIGGNAPSLYITKIEEMGLSPTEFDKILTSHLIEPNLIRSNNFYAFFENREKQLATLASSVMRKDAVPAQLTAEVGDLGGELTIDEEETLEEIA